MTLTKEEFEHIKRIEDENKTLKKIMEGLEIAYGSIVDDLESAEEPQPEELIFKQFISTLSDEEKKWLSFSIVGVVCADGKITSSELSHLRYVLAFLDKKYLNEIMVFIKRKELPKLDVLKTNRKKSSQILMYLASIVITDDMLVKEEVDYFKYLGGKLGFDPAFSTELMKWGKEFIMVNRLKRKLLKIAEDTPPVYQTVALHKS